MFFMLKSHFDKTTMLSDVKVKIIKLKIKLDYYKWLFLKRLTAMKIARHRVLSKRNAINILLG